MATTEQQFDDAMYEFSTGNYAEAISKLSRLLAHDPANFDAQLALGMAHYRLGDYPTAIREGHKAEQLRPSEQLVHTNLSLFYMKAGDKKTAEHHGLQARIASWKGNMTPPAPGSVADPELQIATPKGAPTKLPAPEKFPDMPWKKKKAPASPDDAPKPSGLDNG